tara:strand:- start:926 stop:1084 length:159 start_codon:yes stop_codon:yes gene_type:complete
MEVRKIAIQTHRMIKTLGLNIASPKINSLIIYKYYLVVTEPSRFGFNHKKKP